MTILSLEVEVTIDFEITRLHYRLPWQKNKIWTLCSLGQHKNLVSPWNVYQWFWLLNDKLKTCQTMLNKPYHVGIFSYWKSILQKPKENIVLSYKNTNAKKLLGYSLAGYLCSICVQVILLSQNEFKEATTGSLGIYLNYVWDSGVTERYLTDFMVTSTHTKITITNEFRIHWGFTFFT